MRNVRIAVFVAVAGAMILLAACKANKAPETPAALTGPNSGEAGGYYGFATSSTSPDGDSIRMVFSWGDSLIDTTALDPSGTAVSDSHSWVAAGTFGVKALALDMEGRISAWTAAHDIVISAAAKVPPNTPPPPSGPTEGTRNAPLVFFARTTDPDGESLAYRFDWDYRSEKSDWTAFFPSGDSASAQYSWSHVGTYDIRVQAKDTEGHVSSWSAPHSMTIP
jgi:hypothetical protein